MQLCATSFTFRNRICLDRGISICYALINKHTQSLVDRFRRQTSPIKSVKIKRIRSEMEESKVLQDLPIHLRIDPLHLTGVFRLMTAKSFEVYKSSWMDFIKHSNISTENPPSEENFASFFAMKRDAGLSGSTLKSIYSHLNKIHSHLYNQKLGVSASFLLFSYWRIKD